MKSFRHFVHSMLFAVLALAAFVFAHGAAMAQAYPARPVRWIVPFAAGGPLDVLTRTIARPLSASLGQPVIVEARASSSGITGNEAVAKASPDGHSLLTHANLVPQKFLYPSLPYDVQRDFAPITLLGRALLVLWVHESVPVADLNEFLAYAKSRPGKLAYASAGIGQPAHLMMEVLKQRAGMDILHVPHKGGAQIMLEIISGRIQAALYTAQEQLLSQIKTGRLRAIAVIAERRMPALPEVQTFEEAGMRDFRNPGWVAVSATGGTPKAIVERLNRDIIQAIAAPEVQERYARQNMQPTTSSPEQLTQVIRDDIEHLGPVIKALNVTVD